MAGSGGGGGFESLAEAAAPGNDALAELCRGAEGAPRHIVAMSRPGGDELVYLVEPHVPPGCIVVPGSFNPMHDGHEQLGSSAAELTGKPPEALLFELCVTNADKGEQALGELQRRAEGVVQRGHRLLISRATLYVEKASLCRSCDFVVGYDTYRRIVDPKYYVPNGAALDAASEEERTSWVLAALRRIDALGVRFLVAGRVADDGAFLDLESSPLLAMPEDLAGMFAPIPGFRNDVSSTELRQRLALEVAVAA